MTSLLSRGENVARLCVQFFDAQFESSSLYSCGLLGSFANRAPRPVSDIDIYLVTQEASELHNDLEEGLTRWLSERAPEEPMIQRVSVFRASLQHLRDDALKSSVIRFPLFDRWMLSEGYRRHLGGFEFEVSTLHKPSASELIEGSAEFLAQVVAQKIIEADLTRILPKMDVALAKRLGHVNLTKVVLIPMRLLALSSCVSEGVRGPALAVALASTEQAFESLPAHHRNAAYWPLVEGAMSLRDVDEPGERHYREIAGLLPSLLPDLYRATIQEYISMLNTLGRREHVPALLRLERLF